MYRTPWLSFGLTAKSIPAIFAVKPEVMQRSNVIWAFDDNRPSQRFRTLVPVLVVCIKSLIEFALDIYSEHGVVEGSFVLIAFH